MTPKTAPEHLDRRVVEFSRTRHDVVSLAELRSLGLTRSGVERRLASGLLHHQHRGVYSVGRARVSHLGRWRAAVLAGGPSAVLSHRSAGALWGIVRSDGARVDVTLGTRAGRRASRRVAAHRPRRPLDASEITIRDGIRVTTLARTLLDLADAVGERALARAVERSEELRLFDLTAVERTITAHAGRRKACRLVQALAVFDPAPTRSELERRFLELCAAHDLPRPLVNSQLAGVEVDFFWPQARFAVETDGFATHGTRAAFERDRDRDARLALIGIRTQRFSHRQVTRDATVVAAVVRAGLGVVAP